jgi:two-component system chemotaxis response regulator CheY
VKKVKTVLIVDDAAFMRMSLKITLEKIGFKVIGEAATGIEAISLYKQMKPDIVTMDITMPELSGIEALKMIKKIDKEAKVIIISALGQEVMIREAVMAGAMTFIVKPFKEESIIQSLAKII